MSEVMNLEPPGASPRAIQHHYDVSNAFYASWLDASLTYSAAMFEREDEPLELAQQRKLDHHLESAGARDAHRLLDVGCGWGSLLTRARERGVETCVGLTLSREQHGYVSSLAPDGVEVRLESWRDHRPAAPYDAIVSIGAFEHFVRIEASAEEKIAAYRDFFKFCRRNLRSGGRLSLQTIAWGTLRAEQVSSFITESIFPESNLPYLWEILQAADRVLEVVRFRNDRRDYAATCRRWQENLDANRVRACAAAGSDRVEQYERFLRMSAVGFETGALYLTRLTLQAP